MHADSGQPGNVSQLAPGGRAQEPLEARYEALIQPHAVQLKRGFRDLQFASDLEADYRAYYWRRYLGRTRVVLAGGAVLFALFALKDVRTLPAEVAQITAGIRLLLIVPSILLVIALSYAQALRSWMEELLVGGVFIAMAGLSAAILISAGMGSPLPYEGLILVIVFTLFLSGLRFYKASLSTVATVLGYICAGMAIGLPTAVLLQQAYYLISITLIGMAGAYSLEFSVRANFLGENVARSRSLRDPLTLLYNRRAAMDHLDRAWGLALREHKPLAILVIDVDRFKRFNDLYGHVLGDGCLTEVAMILQDRVRRPMDIVARYGGEEFLAVVYGISEQNLPRFCENLRRSVETLAIPHTENSPHNVVTVSIGAARIGAMPGSATIASTLEEADRALYRAKAKGRNRCEIAGASRAIMAVA
jgi:diguanylate cyclase (GGDEF)-like protein